MNIMVSISLAPDETVPTATPAEVLAALGGDPSKDSINVQVSASHSPPPPEPATPPPAPPAS